MTNKKTENTEKRHFVIGTAGHIDHGKTALVKQLTGTDTDWLKEEKARGMTIDLGFAFLGDNITIIDVPGHEKFIRNMVAGVSTIDLVLFIIAADDGVMPQSKEHLDILNLLHVNDGIVVITKTDLVEPDWLELVIEDVHELLKGSILEHANILPVSNETAEGIDAVRNAVLMKYDTVQERPDKGVFRMPIDRVFSMKGFGTVVAGTVISGALADGQNVELLPQGTTERVRGIHIHERAVSSVKTGDRAAINLAGVEKTSIKRGDVLAQPGFYTPTQFLDVKMYLLQSYKRAVKNTARIRLHIGTNEVIGRISILDKDEIAPGEEAFMQIKLEKAVIADVDDRFVIRNYSPLDTMGGGRVLDTHPRRHKRFDPDTLQKLASLEKGDSRTFIERALNTRTYIPQTLKEISQTLGMNESAVVELLAAVCASDIVIQYSEKNRNYYVLRSQYAKLVSEIEAQLNTFHQKNPALRGMSKTELRSRIPKQVPLVFFNRLLNDLTDQNRIRNIDGRLALANFEPHIPPELESTIQAIEKAMVANLFTPPGVKDFSEQMGITPEQITACIEILVDHGKLIKLDENLVFHKSGIEKAQDHIRRFFQANEEMRVGDLGKLLNTSRKYSMPLLNYLDQIDFTIRQGDVRVLNPDFDDTP